MYGYDFEVIERAAEAIEDDCKPVTTHVEPEVSDVDMDDFDMEW